jgi:hypothetical protein
MNTEFVR